MSSLVEWFIVLLKPRKLKFAATESLNLGLKKSILEIINYALKKSKLHLKHLIELAEKKCEIKGIRHILKSRLLQIPEGVDKLPLKVDITRQEIGKLFERLIKEIIEKEV